MPCVPKSRGHAPPRGDRATAVRTWRYSAYAQSPWLTHGDMRLRGRSLYAGACAKLTTQRISAKSQLLLKARASGRGTSENLSGSRPAVSNTLRRVLDEVDVAVGKRVECGVGRDQLAVAAFGSANGSAANSTDSCGLSVGRCAASRSTRARRKLLLGDRSSEGHVSRTNAGSGRERKRGRKQRKVKGYLNS